MLNYYRMWLENTQLDSEESTNQLELAFDRLTADNIRINLLGADSEGKTRFLDGLLFNPIGGQRPDLAQPCLCPVEYYYDHRNSHQLRLLPIETRLTQSSLQSFKQSDDHWITISFDPRSAESLSMALAKIVERKAVDLDHAQAMGLGVNMPLNEQGQPLIPAWRYASINLDHILLRQGVQILDIPDLYTLGFEPELVFDNLHNAEALWFLLREATSVATDSQPKLKPEDIATWKQYLADLNLDQIARSFVILDTEQQDSQRVQSLRDECEIQLGLQPQQIFLGTEGPYQGSEASNQVETRLANTVISHKVSLVQNQVIQSHLANLHSNRKTLRHRREILLEQIQALQKNPENRITELTRMETEGKTELGLYHRRLIKLKTQRKRVAQASQQMQALLDKKQCQQMRYQTGKQCADDWRFVTLDNAINDYFSQVNNKLQQLKTLEINIQQSINEIYQEHEVEHGLAPIDYRRFDTNVYEHELFELKNKSARYRRYCKRHLDGQQLLMKRYFVTVTSAVEHLLQRISQDICDWEETVLLPLYQNILKIKQVLEQQVLLTKSLLNQTQDIEHATRDLHDLLAQLEAQLQQADQLVYNFRSSEPEAQL